MCPDKEIIDCYLYLYLHTGKTGSPGVRDDQNDILMAVIITVRW